MKSYVKVYLKYFGYTESDFILCEVCNKERANDLHHILSRKRRPDLLNEIGNLMAICRECHIRVGEKNHLIEYLQEIHNRKMNEINRRR